MEVSGQLHALTALPLGKNPGSHWCFIKNKIKITGVFPQYKNWSWDPECGEMVWEATNLVLEHASALFSTSLCSLWCWQENWLMVAFRSIDHHVNVCYSILMGNKKLICRHFTDVWNICLIAMFNNILSYFIIRTFRMSMKLISKLQICCNMSTKNAYLS
jgi:hypothetical protein